METLRKPIGREIEEARIAAGMSRLDLAYHSGLSQSTVWRIERGASQPNRGTVRLLRLALASGRNAP
jgi:transcriptional regulator with XRE-family HTH domain